MMYSALVLGLLGSFHCLGMCGPLSLAISQQSNRQQYMLSGMVYNLGRTLTYGILGLIMGSVGLGFKMIGLQQSLSIISGTLVCIFAITTIFHVSLMPKGIGRWTAPLKRWTAHYFANQKLFSRFILGTINGILPCGMVYIALASSMTQLTPFNSGVYMVIFGLGTVPMMLGIWISGKLISVSFKQKITKATPYLSFVIGVLFILRGLALNIPYLSPKIEMQEDSIENHCCSPSTACHLPSE